MSVCLHLVRCILHQLSHPRTGLAQLSENAKLSHGIVKLTQIVWCPLPPPCLHPAGLWPPALPTWRSSPSLMLHAWRRRWQPQVCGCDLCVLLDAFSQACVCFIHDVGHVGEVTIILSKSQSAIPDGKAPSLITISFLHPKPPAKAQSTVLFVRPCMQ
jgi:hypothetical protein